jgi:hypothetical protein
MVFNLVETNKLSQTELPTVQSNNKFLQSKIEAFLEKYGKNINDLSKGIIDEYKDCVRSNNETISRTKVTNYKSLNQNVYTSMVKCEINKIKEKLAIIEFKEFRKLIKDEIRKYELMSRCLPILSYLPLSYGINSSDINIFNEKYKLYKKNNTIINNNYQDVFSSTIMPDNYCIEFYIKYFDKVYLFFKKKIIRLINRANYQYYYKLIYILFYYAPMIRNLISRLQNPNTITKDGIIEENPTKFTRHGIIHITFIDNDEHDICHYLNTQRLETYNDRILTNLKSNDRILTNLKSNDLKIKIYYNKNKNVYMYANLNHNNFYYNYLFGNNSLGNYSKTLEDRFEFINLLCEYLKELDRLKTNLTEKERKKELIMRFYYVIILLMPFMLGTASIAEVMLYSMWEYYLGEKVKIDQKCLLDVEALTLPFDNFYKNCFESDGTEYTPYLQIS